MLGEPREGGVADNGKHPSTRTSPVEISNPPESAQARLLHDILGVSRVAGKPACQCQSICEVRFNNTRKALRFVGRGHLAACKKETPDRRSLFPFPRNTIFGLCCIISQRTRSRRLGGASESYSNTEAVSRGGKSPQV